MTVKTAKPIKLSEKQKAVLGMMTNGDVLYCGVQTRLAKDFYVKKIKACNEKTAFALLGSGLVYSVGDFRYAITTKGKTLLAEPQNLRK